MAQQCSTTQRCLGTDLRRPAWGWDAGDGHSATQGGYKWAIAIQISSISDCYQNPFTYIHLTNSFRMQRCEEVASLQSQVSQEKELRTVMEGCLMEDKMAWRRVHTELVENHRLVQDMSATLAEFRACRTELLSCFTADEDSSSGVEEGDTVVKGELRCCAMGITFLRVTVNRFTSSCSQGDANTLQYSRANKEAGFSWCRTG